MCRFVLYQGPPLALGSLVVDPANSIIKQSLRARETDDPLNGDGFGVAWYAPDMSAEPATFRSFTPAWSNRNLLELARVTKSGCILAHVRAATPGLPISELDCHPFTAGPYSMMHNGDLGGFRQMRRQIISGLSDRAFDAVHGGTDTEHLFAMVLDRLWSSSSRGSAEHLTDALTSAVKDVLALSRRVGVKDESYLNIALSDGNRSVALRFTTADPSHASSLYFHTGRRYICEGTVCRMVEPEHGQGTAIVCSEPLSDDPGWQKVPVNHLVVVHDDRTTELRPISA